MGATDLQDCKDICMRYNFGGFVVKNEMAHFRKESGEAMVPLLRRSVGCTVYKRDVEAESVRFCITVPDPELPTFMESLEEWLAGGLVEKMKSTPDDLVALKDKADRWAEGVCKRSERTYCDFGKSLRNHLCAFCGRSCMNWRCKGCHKPFCN